MTSEATGKTGWKSADFLGRRSNWKRHFHWHISKVTFWYGSTYQNHKFVYQGGQLRPNDRGCLEYCVGKDSEALCGLRQEQCCNGYSEASGAIEMQHGGTRPLCWSSPGTQQSHSWVFFPRKQLPWKKRMPHATIVFSLVLFPIAASVLQKRNGHLWQLHCWPWRPCRNMRKCVT